VGRHFGPRIRDTDGAIRGFIARRNPAAVDGHTVGIAALGTALTDRQADLLRPYIRADGPGILVATDNDPTGQRAVERI
jgi:hypothetical protein